MHNVNRYYLLRPASFKLDGGAMFGIIPKPLWEKRISADEDNRIKLALRPLLIRSENRIILTDTGIGDYHTDKFVDLFAIETDSNPLLNTLAAINIGPDDITDIIISHLHFDHVGGLGKLNDSQSWSTVCKNAQLHLHAKHYHYAHNCNVRDKGSFHTNNFDPIINWYKENNQINWLEDESGTIIKDADTQILYKCSHGHTPYMVHPYNDKFFYLADLIPTSAHIDLPWVMGYDMNPGITTQEKKEILEFILEKNLTVIFEHDPTLWGATLQKNEKNRIQLKETFPDLGEVTLQGLK